MPSSSAEALRVDALAVMLPHLGVVPDVPVVDGTVPTPAAAASDGATAASGLDLAAVENAPVTSLETYSEQFGGQVRTRADAQTVKVNIDTDVLFAFDSADLSPEAQAALDAAAGQTLESGAGTLSITGHTDDSGSDAYNHELSERRAQAVAQALAGRLPADRYPTTFAGRGETEPAVPNTSEEGRALNRRVELVLTTSAGANTVSASPPAAAPLPAPPPAVGRGADGVEVAPESGPGSFRVAAPQARRIGSALVVDIQVTPVSGHGGVIGGLLSTGAVGSRGQFDPLNQYASNGVRLLSGAEATYPLDYVIGTESDGVPQRTCLCERWLNQDSPIGVTTTATVWLPDPGTDVSTVTLDVEGLLRLTDVPVS